MATVNMNDIKTLIAGQLGIASVNETDRVVEDLGAESSDVANIIAAIEDKYHIQVPEGSIKSIQTVRDVFSAVQKA